MIEMMSTIITNLLGSIPKKQVSETLTGFRHTKINGNKIQVGFHGNFGVISTHYEPL